MSFLQQYQSNWDSKQASFDANIVFVVRWNLYTFAIARPWTFYYVCWTHSNRCRSPQLDRTKCSWKGCMSKWKFVSIFIEKLLRNEGSLWNFNEYNQNCHDKSKNSFEMSKNKPIHSLSAEWFTEEDKRQHNRDCFAGSSHCSSNRSPKATHQRQHKLNAQVTR